METQSAVSRNSQGSGIRLSRLNVLLIIVGLVIALFMVFSMYQTSESFRQIVSVTDAYLSAQQTAGMLSGISSDMSEQCAAFISTGVPDLVHAYAGQLNALNGQFESNEAFQPEDGNRDEFLMRALEAFRSMTATEIRAMRLMADTLPAGLEAFPALIRETELSAGDQALSPAEKAAAAKELISSEEYRALGKSITEAVDDSHRVASEKGKNRALQTSEEVSRIIGRQQLLVFLFVVVAIVALVLNHALIISPIRQCVDRLDRREPLPVQGCYEVRHLAGVYNEVLKDNAEKAEALTYTASHDALTGLYNRAEFDRIYRQSEKGKTGVMIADVNHFKQFNDEYGHEVGDNVLKAVADKLTEHFRPEDHVCRIGGDEFCVIMPGASQEQAPAMVDAVLRINRELAENHGSHPPVTISAGFAFWDRPDPEGSLFTDADKVLLDVKKTRTSCCAVYPG